MDYLVCEEENAEILQFFTWFCEYVVRWGALTPQEKLQSPPWKPTESAKPVDEDKRSGSRISIHTHRRARSNRLNQILEILEEKDVQANMQQISDQSHKKGPDPINFSTPRKGPKGNTTRPQKDRSFGSEYKESFQADGDSQRCE